MGQSWRCQHKFSWPQVARALTVASALALAGCTAVGPDCVAPARSAPWVWRTELPQELAAQA